MRPEDYTQVFHEPERIYSAELWPWYLRFPWFDFIFVRLRQRYAKAHPEIFGRDYK